MKVKILMLCLFVSFGIKAQTKKWTLQECVAYALENNISIQQSELDLKSVDVERLDAIGAFLPSISANSNYGANTGANINPATNQFENQTFSSFSAGASVGMNLFSGLTNWRRLQRAKLSKVASEYRLDKRKDDISLMVANSFLQILFNKENVKVRQAQIQLTIQNVNRTKELVEAGSLPKGDLYEIEATMATQEQELINAENALFISKIGLAQTLLLENYEEFDIVDMDMDVPLASILQESPESIANKAKEVRSEVKIATTNVEISEKAVQISRGSYLPRVSGFIGYNTRWSESINIDFQRQLFLFDGTSIGVQLNVPILNGLSARNNVKRGKITLENNKLQLTQAELDLERNVYQAYKDTENAQKSYDAALKTLSARNLSFEYAQERYNVGLMNAFDYNQAKLQFDNAQSEVIRSKYDYIFKLKVLEFYFGIQVLE